MVITPNIISYKYLIMSRNQRGKIAVVIAGCDGNGKTYKFGGVYDFLKRVQESLANTKRSGYINYYTTEETPILVPQLEA
jgi:hypothetical protein